MTRSVVIALLVLPMVLSGCGSSEEEDSEAAALSTIEAAYETFNSGDVDTWADIRVRGSYFTCDTTFMNSAGVEYQEAFEWVVADDQVVAVRSDR